MSLDLPKKIEKYLVRSEAVVELDDADLVPTLSFLETRLSKDLIGAVL